MDVKVTAQRLCFLLSWQEALSRTPQNEACAGRAYRKQAAQAVAQLRGEARTAIQDAGAKLQALMAQKNDGPEAAALRHRIGQLNHLLKATDAAHLGGPIAMTLEAYADAFGAKRGGPLRLDRDDRITVAVALVLMVVICLGLAWFYLWRANTTFEIEPSGRDYLALHMANGGQRPVAFIGSWPDLMPDSDLPLYGVTLYCRPVGADAFQLSTAIGDVWIYQSEYLAPQRQLAVEPGVTITLLLDIRELESAYGEPLEAIRIECGTPRRRRQAVFTETVAQAPGE